MLRAERRGGHHLIRMMLGLGRLPTIALVSSTLEAARSQMAFTLGFHIVLASLGVAFPALMLIANYRGLRRDDADALLLARRWSHVVAVTFADRKSVV